VKDSIGLGILPWQWALIGSGTTLILSLAGFGLFKLVTPDAKVTALDSPTKLQQVTPLPTTNAAPQQQIISNMIQSTLSTEQIQAKEREAKTYIGSMNRAQQAFLLEKEQFSLDLSSLGLGIRSETASYSYQIRLLSGINAVQNIALSKLAGLRTVTGIVSKVKMQTTGETTTLALLCVSDGPTLELPSEPRLVNGEVTCPAGYSPLN
jgi:hypothetical protein